MPVQPVPSPASRIFAAVLFLSAAACNSVPAAPVAPAAPGAGAQPGAKLADAKPNEDWITLGRFIVGDSWYAIWDGSYKVGYAHIDVREEDGSFSVKQTAHWTLGNAKTVVIDDGWFSYDSEMRLVGYVSLGPGENDRVFGRAMLDPASAQGGPVKPEPGAPPGGSDAAAISANLRGEAPKQDGNASKPAGGLILVDPKSIPFPVLGQVARFLPQEKLSVVTVDAFDPVTGKVKPGGNFCVTERALAPNPGLDINGWLIHYVADGYIFKTFVVDELGRLLLQCNGAGITFTSRWLATNTAADALYGLPPDLLIAEEDKIFLPPKIERSDR